MNKEMQSFEYDQFFPNGPEWQPKKAGSVAIITRTKDRAILLARAFGSVLSQEYSNWKLYVVNDGGDPVEVNRLVERHAHLFGDRITVIHNENSLGMEAASNKAVSIAKEDYLVVHDDDDSWHPDFLKETVSFLEKSENRRYGAVLTNCIVIREVVEGDVVRETAREKWGYFKPFVDGRNLLRENSTPPICVLVRAAVVRKIGLFNADLPVLGDWDYFLRIFQETDIGTIGRELAYYHHRPKSSAQYGNSVVDGFDKHQRYQVLYRNAVIRKAMQSDPGTMGLLHTLLSAQDVAHREMMDKLNWIDRRISEVEGGLHHRLSQVEGSLHHRLSEVDDRVSFISMVSSWQWKILRPFYWVWRKAYPLRRIVAKARGRQ